MEAFRAAEQAARQGANELTSVLAPSLIVIYGQPEFTQEPGLQSAEVFVVQSIMPSAMDGFPRDKLHE